MKRKDVFFMVLAMLTILFSACSNNFVETEVNNLQGVCVQLNIDMARTVMPSGFLNAKYTLTGSHDGKSKTFVENKTASELQNQVLWLESGTWSFTLDAYVGSTKKGTATISNQTISSNSATLTFTFEGVSFDYANGTGGTSVTLTFPATAKVDKVTAQLFNADGSENANFTQNSLTPTAKDNSLQQVTFINASLSSGSYLLVFNLYQDSAMTQKIGQ